MEGDLILDPLMKYLMGAHQRSTIRSSSSPHITINAKEAIEALATQGYYHIPSVLTHGECDEALDQLWDFVEDTSGGCVQKKNPLSWYPEHEVVSINNGKEGCAGLRGRGAPDADNKSIVCTNPKEHDDLDPWPHTGHHSFPDMFQSLGAGLVLGNVREKLAERIFEPLFGTRELLCSKEGFTFARPLVVNLGDAADDGNDNNVLVWKRNNINNPANNGNAVSSREPQTHPQGQHYNQAVPISAMNKLQVNDDERQSAKPTNGSISKKQQKRDKKKLEKLQKFKDMAGLCHIQTSVSFTDQTIDKNCGGGHFLCYPNSHSTVHWKLVGGTTRATPPSEQMDPATVPLSDEEIRKLGEMGCTEKRIYANKGDIILWRSDLVHAEVPPKNVHGMKTSSSGPREFRAVGYCSMIPVQAAKDYTMHSLPKQKVVQSKKGRKELNNLSPNQERVCQMTQAKVEEVYAQKLEAYKTGRTGDHKPNTEVWHEHRRVTMWNNKSLVHQYGITEQRTNIPPRILQRPKFRLGAPELTVRQAELYGLLPYRESMNDANCDEEIRKRDIERAVIRCVRFVEGVYKCRHNDGTEVGPSWRIKDGKFCSDEGLAEGNKVTPGGDIPICTASMEVLTMRTYEGAATGLQGQDKYLGGMASPCGRYIYGVPGHAKRTIQVDTQTGEVSLIGPEYEGEFKWLRGVEIPADVMGLNDDGSHANPNGCCLALPCNSENGCVLKIDPSTSKVSTFVTGPPVPNVEEGWLYHGGNLSSHDGLIYAIPASAPRVMKINPRDETTEYIGPEFPGKAKWYGGIIGSDNCIYGIPHNSSGVLKINPMTQEVTVLAEGTLPEGMWKWHGGHAAIDGTKIIGYPNNADSVLIIDVPKQQVYTVGDSSILRSGYHRVPHDGRYKYLGGSLTEDGKLAYLFPCDAEYCLQFDMETDEMKLVGPHLTEGENKFQNGFVGTDGCVYGIPQRSQGVLRIIPPGVKRYNRNGKALPVEEEHVDVIYCGDEIVSCKDKFEGGVLGNDQKIYCIPLRAKAFVNIIPGKK